MFDKFSAGLVIRLSQSLGMFHINLRRPNLMGRSEVFLAQWIAMVFCQHASIDLQIGRNCVRQGREATHPRPRVYFHKKVVFEDNKLLTNQWLPKDRFLQNRRSRSRPVESYLLHYAIQHSS